jgi:hypothetical protein
MYEELKKFLASIKDIYGHPGTTFSIKQESMETVIKELECLLNPGEHCAWSPEFAERLKEEYKRGLANGWNNAMKSVNPGGEIYKLKEAEYNEGHFEGYGEGYSQGRKAAYKFIADECTSMLSRD